MDSPVFFIVFGLAIYFIPAMVAANRSHHNATAIFMLNLLLGWTFLGWVITLVWACTEVRTSEPDSITPCHDAPKPKPNDDQQPEVIKPVYLNRIPPGLRPYKR